MEELYADTSGILAAKRPSNLVEAPRVNEKYSCEGVSDSAYYRGDLSRLATRSLVGGEPLADLNSVFFDKANRPFSGGDLLLHKQLDDPRSHHRRSLQPSLWPYGSMGEVPLPLAGTFYDKDDFAALKAWREGSHPHPEILKYDPYLLQNGTQLRNSAFYKPPPARQLGHAVSSGGVKGSRGLRMEVRGTPKSPKKATATATPSQSASAREPLANVTNLSSRRAETIKVPLVAEQIDEDPPASPPRHMLHERSPTAEFQTS